MSEHDIGDGLPVPPPEDAGAYQRPNGVSGPFEASDWSPPQAPPNTDAPTPAERAVFGRPTPDVDFAPLPGERVPPRPMDVPPVPYAYAQAFGTPPDASGGFRPEYGTRIAPGLAQRRPDGPDRDLWRDNRQPFWLGGGAVFPSGLPVQIPPEQDAESEGFLPPPSEDPADAGGATVLRLGKRTIATGIAIALIVGALGGAIGFFLAHTTRDSLHRPDVSLAKTGTPANRPAGSVADIAKRVGPAVVSISVSTSTEYAVGSGVVVDKHGYVLTNDHVIAMASGGKGTIIVTFSDAATAKARIVGEDPFSDLAVLKVPTDQLTVASLGDSSKIAVGDPVMAIGSPLDLQGTVTSGIISALNRPVHISDASTGQDVYIDAIQTDAAINHGNSGGALVDASGAVIGINSAAALSTPDSSGGSSSVSGIGFAIPINFARTIADELIHTGKATTTTIGVQGRSSSTADGLQLGVYLVQVTSGGPAAKAGLKSGDVIIAADGQPVSSIEQLMIIVQQHKVGDHLAVTYYRGGAKQTATVILGAQQ